MRSWSASLLTKCVFFKWIYVIRSLCQINAHYPQLYADIIFADASYVLVMFDMIFQTRGEGAMVTMFAWGAW